jgi:hypothetical protein
MTYRKHAVVHVAPLAVIAFWIGLCLAIDTEPFYRRIVSEELGGFDPLLALVIVVLIPIELHRMLVARSAVVTVDQTGVRYCAGVLPWRKVAFHWLPEQIFIATVDDRRLFRWWALGYGTVALLGKEGTTREVAFERIRRARDCAAAINAILPRA